ncbi:hypothetical protein [Methanogenium cariaci]|uniref:hypothetical protein n=1 Tax=Methanogenium cariaci TaxID=2197 RepID=UPI00247FF9FA|nr:hypothetical protein [Methanogenium cariaci]
MRERTQDVSKGEKPTVLIFGLSPMHRTETAAGIAWGLKTTESYLIEEIINAKNAYRSNTGSFQVVSTEQVLSMNPDVIILGTAAGGYHPPPEELYCATYYTHLRELSAVQNHRVTALPFAPRNAAQRLEYPLDLMVMAKTVYPDRFEDVKMDEWMLAFYREVYGVDENIAKEICAAQLMNWCIEE